MQNNVYSALEEALWGVAVNATRQNWNPSHVISFVKDYISDPELLDDFLDSMRTLYSKDHQVHID